jgi:hypothetical protein
VYFAGHGMEISGENWLIPVDAELKKDTDAANEAISLRSVMLQVSNTTSLAAALRLRLAVAQGDLSCRAAVVGRPSGHEAGECHAGGRACVAADGACASSGNRSRAGGDMGNPGPQ